MKHLIVVVIETLLSENIPKETQFWNLYKQYNKTDFGDDDIFDRPNISMNTVIDCRKNEHGASESAETLS